MARKKNSSYVIDYPMDETEDNIDQQAMASSVAAMRQSNLPIKKNNNEPEESTHFYLDELANPFNESFVQDGLKQDMRQAINYEPASALNSMANKSYGYDLVDYEESNCFGSRGDKISSLVDTQLLTRNLSELQQNQIKLNSARKYTGSQLPQANNNGFINYNQMSDDVGACPLSPFASAKEAQVQTDATEFVSDACTQTSCISGDEHNSTNGDVTSSKTHSDNEQHFTGLAYRAYITDQERISKLYDESLFKQISAVPYIQQTTEELNMLKNTIKDKKELKERRNVQTAKLSRDRKKLEVEFMREVGVAYLTCLNKVRNHFAKQVQSGPKDQAAFAQSSLNKIAQYTEEVPQNFEFMFHTVDMNGYSSSGSSDRTYDNGQSSLCLSDMDASSQAGCSVPRKKKGRPRKIQPPSPSSAMLEDKRELKRQRKGDGPRINFEEYVQKPNLVARLTMADEPTQKKELLHKKRAIEQNQQNLNNTIDTESQNGQQLQVNQSDSENQSIEREISAFNIFPTGGNQTRGRGGVLAKAGLVLGAMVAVMSGSNSYNNQPNENAQNEPEVLLQSLSEDIAEQVTISPGFGRQLLSTNEVQNLDMSEEQDSQDIDESEFKVPQPVIGRKKSCNAAVDFSMTDAQVVDQKSGQKVQLHGESWQFELASKDDCSDQSMTNEDSASSKGGKVVSNIIQVYKTIPTPTEQQVVKIDSPNDQVCDSLNNAKTFLKTLYKVEDLREDYLQRQIRAICQNVTETKDAEVEKDSNLWVEEEEASSDARDTEPMVDFTLDSLASSENMPKFVKYQSEHSEKAVETSTGLVLPQQQKAEQTYCEAGFIKNEFERLRKETTTLYSENPYMIMGGAQKDAAGIQLQNNASKDEYIHILMPASQVNLLNAATVGGQADAHSKWGPFQESHMNDNKQQISGDDSATKYIEIGCKVFEINHISYPQASGSSSVKSGPDQHLSSTLKV